MASRATVISISHGGGPMPVLGSPSQSSLIASLRNAVPKALKLGTTDAPRAIVLVTAHWETSAVNISSGTNPSLLYDYYGFPPESYKFKYPAPGAPDVAERVAKALQDKGIAHEMNTSRGWDHGVFIPMMLIHPAADIPIVQVSVLRNQDPQALFDMGRALAPLRELNIAIIGSGQAGMHNLELMFSHNSDRISKAKKEHPAWMKAVHGAALEEKVEERREKFSKWRKWQGAYYAHPDQRAEHFSPLIVCAGAAGDGAAQSWVDEAMGWPLETFYWQK